MKTVFFISIGLVIVSLIISFLSLIKTLLKEKDYEMLSYLLLAVLLIISAISLYFGFITS